MSNVCILGAGELGGATAHALARGERVGRVLLIDEHGTMAAGKALDIQQAGAVEGFHTHVNGTADFTRVTGATVVVIADPGRMSDEWSAETALSMISRLNGYAADAAIVFAGVAHADLILIAERDARFDRRLLLGSAPEALAAAIRSIVALEARSSPSEVMLSVLGTPPAGFVVPWSEASIGGYALERVLSQVQIRQIEARVARLWPPGPHALGAAAARVVEALVTSSRRPATVLTVLGGEFGVHGRVGALPCILGPTGIVDVRLPTLNARERVQLETALGA